MSDLILTTDQWQAMRHHAEIEAPLEACGLLAGRGMQVETVLQIRNKAQSPTRYSMDPQEQLHAFDWIDSNGMELLAIYHSHPAGPAAVSATDIEEAAYPVVYVVWSRLTGEWQASAFRIADGAVSEVLLEVR